MFKGIKNQLKGYLLLLVQRQPKKRKVKKRRLLRKKPPKPKFILDTLGKDLKEIGSGKAPKVEMGNETPMVRAKKGVYHENCLNCGEKLDGLFCHKCGQKDSDYRRPYWSFLEDMSDNLFTRDSKIWRTIAYLIFLPGAMTRDYIQGKRIRYIPPIRLFLVSIILFFLTINVFNVAVLKFVGDPVTYEERLATLTERLEKRQEDLAKVSEEDTFERDDALYEIEKVEEDLAELETWRQEQEANPNQDEVDRTEDGQLIYDYNTDAEMFTKISEDDQHIPEKYLEDTFQMDVGDEDVPFLGRYAPKVERGLRNAAQDPTRLNNGLNNWVPLIVGLFIPLTAILLRFFYWKREQYIFNHLIFSLHFHTYIFFILTFFVLAEVFLPSQLSTWMFVSAVPLYFLVALKVSTGQGWWRTIGKFTVISFFYFIGFSIMLAAVFFFAFADA